MRALPLIAVLLVAGALPAQASDADLLFKKYKCTKCHAVDHRPGTAPSYDEIMKKYKGQASAAADLAKVVKDGGGDVWGMERMPANSSIPDADVKAMVDWILKH
jgi:cytochrome c551/c552